jgi:hypothetical protein
MILLQELGWKQLQWDISISVVLVFILPVGTSVSTHHWHQSFHVHKFSNNDYIYVTMAHIVKYNHRLNLRKYETSLSITLALNKVTHPSIACTDILKLWHGYS